MLMPKRKKILRLEVLGNGQETYMQKAFVQISPEEKHNAATFEAKDKTVCGGG